MPRSLRAIVSAFRSNADGATVIEYGLVVAIMAAATVAVLTSFGTAFQQAFSTIGSSIQFNAE